MKPLNMLRLLCVSFLLTFFLVACAGSEAMMTDNNTEQMEMEKNTMKGDTMQAESDSDSMMKPNTMKEDGMMNELPTAMLSGSKGHHAAGKITFSREMGKTRLVLSDLNVDKVPDGHVYLARNGDRKKGINLGILRQFKGNVEFPLPDGADPAAFDSVIIYCEKFDVEIGRAGFGKTM